MLQFNLERRDRRRREYVLLEEGDGEAIMEILRPIVQQNRSTVSMGNKLEVCPLSFYYQEFFVYVHSNLPSESDSTNIFLLVLVEISVVTAG